MHRLPPTRTPLTMRNATIRQRARSGHRKVLEEKCTTSKCSTVVHLCVLMAGDEKSIMGNGKKREIKIDNLPRFGLPSMPIHVATVKHGTFPTETSPRPSFYARVLAHDSGLAATCKEERKKGVNVSDVATKTCCTQGVTATPFPLSVTSLACSALK
uniref:Uncharacterized protein n=1 Tax=Trypanosoma vivax (strain Y486) TaxID=1055687 RepID=G0TSV1_TRYVY|nr:hypothetical protein, unlikely [Trypanosoma vivax Y486]